MKYENVYHKISEFGSQLLQKKSLAEGIPLIAKYAKEVIGAERCSIFIYNSTANKLWTIIADGVQKIEIDASTGVVGYTLKEKKPLVIDDPYHHPAFLKEVDEKTGYKTKNIITAPIFNSSRRVIGVLELLNKEGGFDNEDKRFMIFFAHYISGFIELSNHIKGDD